MTQAQQAEAGGSLGKLVVEKGLATSEEVSHCLKIQAENADSGVFVRLGEIFVREGLLSPDQVQDLLALQNVKILVCSKCFTKYNVEGWTEGSDQSCIRCEATLVEPSELASLAVEDTVADEEPRVTELGILNLGTRLFGSYEILGEISRGGMGIVYKARQQELGRIVALKVLLTGGESLDEDIQRFQREARAVARLRHQNIVGIHEIGEVRGIHFFSMNYIQGISLDQLVDDQGVGREQMLEILCTLCDAVQYAHNEGVLHRDLKPTNILVTKSGDPYLIDFGIAKFRGGDGSGQLTKKGYLFGSPLYMAPEYVAGKLPEYDARCDVYALGVILFKMLSDHTPYEDDETVKILRRILQESPVSILSVMGKNFDRDLATICDKAIDRDPYRRYQTPLELAADIRRYLAGDEIQARPRGLLHRVWIKAREKVAFLTTLVLCGLVLWGAIKLARQGNRIDELQQSLQEAQEQTRSGLSADLRRVDKAIVAHPRSAGLQHIRASLLRRLGKPAEAAAAEQAAKRLESPR